MLWLRSIRRTLSLLCCLAVACSASAADDDQADAESSEAELRALTDAEIVGEIAPDGQMREVVYEVTGSRPQYRAFRFQAPAGFRLSASVVANDGADALAYILADNFRTIARNDDRAPGAKDARIDHEIKKAGTYYFAFRNKARAKTTFRVTLASPPAWLQGWTSSPSGRYTVTATAPFETTYSNVSGFSHECPTRNWEIWDGSNAQGSTQCVIDVNARTIGCGGLAPVPIGEDGRFEAQSRFGGDSLFEARSISGRLEPNGGIELSSLFALCRQVVPPFASYSYYFQGSSFVGARGTAVPAVTP